jgi:hypothetical protein
MKPQFYSGLSHPLHQAPRFVKLVFLEIIRYNLPHGAYNPHKKTFKVNEERVKYWLSQSVQLSPTVHNLFIKNKLMEGERVRAFNTPKKPTPAEATEAKPAAEAVKTEAAPVAAETPVAEVNPSTEQATA